MFFLLKEMMKKFTNLDCIFHSIHDIIYRDLFIKAISTCLNLLDIPLASCHKYLIMPYQGKKSQTLMIRKIREYFLPE